MAGIPGIAQLDIALDVINKNPETHDQSAWARATECGTQFCVAGHLAILDGADASGLTQPAWEDEGYESIGGYMDAYIDYAWDCRTPQQILKDGLSTVGRESDTLVWPDGTERQISDEARRILGVDGRTASALFNGSNTIEEIKRLRNWLAEHESITGYTGSDGYTYGVDALPDAY